MLERILIVLVLACGVFAQTQDFDESFTIFIDLDDFLVTQLGNHEFLTHHTIGEHDNVLLELSEAQVKHFMDKHDTHDCEPPSEIHEVVSFIQTAMYENPAVPNFIDDALNANYQSNMWNPQAQQMQNPFAAFQGAAPFPPAWPASFQTPKPHVNSEPVVAAPAPAPAPANSATTMSVAAPSTPVSTSSAQVDIAQAIASEKNDQTEEEAVARFRDAYRAYKYMTRAMDGLGEYSGAAAASMKQEGGAPKGGWLDSVLDDSDRKILGLFANHRPAVPPGMPSPADGPSFDRELENQINKIVDDTMKNTLGGGSNSAFSAFEAPPASANGAYTDFPSVDQALSSYNIFGQSQQQAQQPIQQAQQQSAVQQQQQQQQQKQHHHHHHHHEAPSADKAIQDIAEKLAQNPEALETLLKIMSGNNPQAAAVEAPKTENPAQPAKAETPQQPAKTETPQQPAKAPQQPAGSRPAAPAMTSHIDKVSDIIPESIYSKDAVPFSEPIQQIKKVAKRILIPRMEEPGPVIGGGLKPTHIKIPAEDIDFGKAYSTRPAPPAQIQMQSSITSAADTNKAQVSVKASTVASANDEALTNPEVVIF